MKRRDIQLFSLSDCTTNALYWISEAITRYPLGRQNFFQFTSNSNQSKRMADRTVFHALTDVS